MYKGIKKFALLVVIPFILCGCWDEVLVEKIAFLTILGVESAPQGNLNVTYAMPVVDPDVTNSRGELIDTQTNLLRMSTETLNRRSGKKIMAGKIQLMLYSKEFAGEGRIADTNSIFERDPSNAVLAWVVIVDGSPRSLMYQTEDNLKDKPRPSTYMNALLERSVSTGNINETRVFNYDLISMAPGIDNTAPMIKITDKSLEVTGSALFSGEKMVGNINAQDGGLLTAMMKTLKHKKYTYNASIPSSAKETYSEKQNSAIQLSQNSKKINISIKNNKPVVDIYLDLSGYADEYKWDHLNDEQEIKKLNDHVQEQLRQDCQKLIGYIQNIQSDPIGIGDMVRAKHNSYFKKVNWHTVYKQAKINIHVKFKLVDYGDIQ
ncbi:Ger(x)C family spore germination protein [Clostridium psychrophilum]|uniref:Ger(x)C family spore germination protein n=1 Tax=Clostridium psychrophilum TaxID=132926 RepID=UPI001C0C9594|nr:Ger(x)C family spore germination protein [Clostridium psychrophilum]MBU3183109.1 Ger(x)C family spore germination protein [Clostridium psychrophilum]